MGMCTISMIAVLGERTRIIGINNDLVWKGLSPDLKRFRTLTYGCVVIMGRKTWDSLPPEFRPLPNRRCFVITRDRSAKFTGATPVASLEEGVSLAKFFFSGEIFIIGGAEIYELGMKYADHLYLTLVKDKKDKRTSGGVYFPEYSEFANVIWREVVPNFLPRLTFEIRAR